MKIGKMNLGNTDCDLSQKVLEAVSLFSQELNISVDCFPNICFSCIQGMGLRDHFMNWDVLKFQYRM